MKSNLVFQVWEGKKSQKNLFMMHEKEWKGRYVNLLHKQTFEELLFTEFRQFSNGVMSSLGKQNKILTQLISIQKSSHTSSPAM